MNQPSSSYRPDRPRCSTLGLWCLTLAAACVFYFVTAQRTVSWQDSGLFQWRVLTGDYVGRYGLALAHPLYIAAGRVLAAISQHHLPFLLNCFSGLGMAVALANLAAVVATLTARRWAGLLTAAMLAVAHTPWWLSTIAEVYTWSVAGLTAELWLLVCLLRRPRWQFLAGLALVNGLGLCVHNFALLPLPVYVVVMVVLLWRKKLPVWALATTAAAWLAGAGLYIGMTLEQAAQLGSLTAAIRSALFGQYSEQVLNVAGGSRQSYVNFALTAMNFVGLLAPLAAIGWIRFRRRLGSPLAATLGAMTLVEVLFFIRYPVPDQFTFVLPTLVMTALAAGIGLCVLADVSRGWRIATAAACLLSLVWQPSFYAAAPWLAKQKNLVPRREDNPPYRDEARYWLIPWKHNERSAEHFAREALAEAGPAGVILTSSTAGPPLLVTRNIEERSPAVTIQYDGHPLSLSRSDAAENRSLLGDRRLYATPGRPLPPGICLKSDEGDVLRAIRWCDQQAQTQPQE